MIYHLSSTTSTNDDAKSERYRDGDIVWADFQSAGRGQRGHQWESRAGENLTFSVVLEPRFLPVVEQFLLSEAVALSLVDLLALYGIDARIKWTNDIYVGDSKIVGILIEHIYSGSNLARTVVGIGINVNQSEFSPLLPNPTSMALLTARRFDTERVLHDFEQCLHRCYALLREGEKQALQSRYNSLLYRLDEPHTFALPDGTRFTGTIRGVKPMGDLLVEDENGVVKGYLFKEIEFVIR
ncbi:MAG: biotin--[Alistipes sp.]|nr:biotin--[acetyl-CoA-carboxylase] ligase [Alistipes sp.]